MCAEFVDHGAEVCGLPSGHGSNSPCPTEELASPAIACPRQLRVNAGAPIPLPEPWPVANDHFIPETVEMGG
jgi:hypothetical protein